MIINTNQTVNKISAKISPIDIKVAKAYIQGVVYCHCIIAPDQTFSVRSLFGGANRDWNGTPLQIIYDYHASSQSNDAAEQAAKDVGWLLKSVLKDDQRTFQYVGKDTGNIYRPLVYI